MPTIRKTGGYINEEHEVEVFELDGQVLFNPYHVGECLGIADVKSSIRNFNKKQVVKVTNSKVQIMHFRKLHNTGENFLTKRRIDNMVKANELKIGEQYYVPGYSGAFKVTLMSINGDYAELQTKKGKKLYRKVQYLFTDVIAANRSIRSWEHGKRKSKKKR